MLKVYCLCLLAPLMLSHAQYREAGLFIGGTNYIGEVGKTTLLGHHLKPHLPPYSTKVIFA